MRRHVLALGAISTLATLPALPAQAALMTGDALHEACSAAQPATTQAQDIVRCRAYIMGVYDDFMAARAMAKQPSCEPQGSTPAQVVDTIIKAMRDQPAFNDSSAGGLVRVTIMTAWPACSMAAAKGG